MTATCSIPECPQPARGRGWCTKHYQRWTKYGDPLTVAWERGDPEANFWVKVRRGTVAECWRWLGYLDADGYGHFSTWDGTKKTDIMAYRYAYSIVIGPIPEGLHLDHLCHVPAEGCPGGSGCPHRACVNPTHLQPVTPGENVRRSLGPAKAAARQRTKTHCPKGHEYNAENTYLHNGHRQCRPCSSARSLARYHANKT